MKSNAKQDIDTAAEKAKEAIDNSDLPEDVKTKAKDAVEKAKEAAKQAIDNATTDADVNTEKKLVNKR
ncbi:DUF1542 domain-containing protein [Carnobacteriaceae bacterium zg-84]|nr:DUF1542 domain-containing protein [Carnobacteriaceae bacterium zg-84]